MSYSLKSIVIDPISKEKPESAIILCHGYGGDGQDISILANYWKNYLPKTIFICPDAPEKCSISPSGFQWFELGNHSEDQILAKSLVAEAKLNKLIDEVKERNNMAYRRFSFINTGMNSGSEFEIFRKKSNELDKKRGVSYHVAVFRNIFGGKDSDYLTILIDKTRMDYMNNFISRMEKRRNSSDWEK